MNERIRRHICASCAAVQYTMLASAPPPPAYIVGERIDLHYDMAGRYWCAACWNSSDGVQIRRLGKLCALAMDEGALPGERESARLRIAELTEKIRRQKTPDPPTPAAAPPAPLTRRQRLIRELSAGITPRLRAWTLAHGAIAIGRVAAQWPLTGSFYFTLAVLCWCIGVWFAIRPNETRITMGQAVAFAVWIAAVSWCSLPFEQIIVGGLYQPG